MILLSDIKGQANAVRFLLGSLSSERIASSYLFSGPLGSARAACAKAFAAALICPKRDEKKDACGICSTCRRIDELKHPDFLWIAQEANDAIKIDQIREVKNVLSLKPYEAPRSICVIESSHMMTQEASNALLKVLEEPPANSVLILITHKKELLLETVISRCTEVRFQSMPVNVIKENKERFVSFIASIMKEKELSCVNWQSDNKEKLVEDIEMLIMLLRDVAIGEDTVGTDIHRFFAGYSIDKIYKVMEQLVEIRLALLGNVNPKLVAQVLPGLLK